MKDFEFKLSTKILFGKRELDQLGQEIKKNGGNKVLLAYGGGSIKKNGIYDQVIEALDKDDIPFMELSGILPNPRLSSAEEGIKIVKENGLDFILAVGGGSTIDCVKLIAAGAVSDDKAWDIVTGKARVEAALPIGVVLTLSATGTEMDKFSVITNEESKEKLGWASDLVMPCFSVMNPEFTYSVNPWHTAAGTADIMSHTMENYFSVNDDAFVQDSMAEGILRTCVKYGPKAINNPIDYEARSNIMWAGTWAINGLLDSGKSHAWSVHPIEHELSAQYDITHGVGLAIITPRWLAHLLSKETAPKIARFGHQVFGLNGDDEMELAKKAIARLYKFFEEELNIPMSLKALEIDASLIDLMAEDAIRHCGGSIKGFVELGKEDVKDILLRCLDNGIGKE